MTTARKPTHADALATLDQLIQQEAATETAYYRAGGHSRRHLDRREALEDARRAVKQLAYCRNGRGKNGSKVARVEG